jgi:hypothetical protein
MKELLLFRPRFDPANRQLDFNDYPGFSPRKLYAIINITAGVPIYVAGAPGLGITNITGAGKVLTLAYDTTLHSTNDRLNVYYDVAAGLETNMTMESGGNIQRIAETQDLILRELKVISLLLAQGLNIQDDLDVMRNDATLLLGSQQS